MTTLNITRGKTFLFPVENFVELVKKIERIGLWVVEKPVESVYNCLYNPVFTKNTPVKVHFGESTKVLNRKSSQCGNCVFSPIRGRAPPFQPMRRYRKSGDAVLG